MTTDMWTGKPVDKPSDNLREDGGDVMTTDQRCRTCRWWDQRAYRELNRSGQKECLHEKLSGAGTDDEDGAFGELDGWIHTGADFGCIHWEKKEGEE